jgi:glucosylceramidase
MRYLPLYTRLFALIFIIISLFVPYNATGQQRVAVWLSSADSSVLLRHATTVKMTSTSSPASGEVILIDPANTCQVMDGVGAALTWSSAYVLKNNLKPTARKRLLKELFTPEGIGINYLRLTIGSSDFSNGNHSYSEYPDSSLSNFSLAMDMGEVIPVLKEILQVNPGIKIMASPWSPPGWMKTGGDMVGGSLKPECYDIFADYLIKYVRTMADLGITVDAITVQNEPEYGTAAYPCMFMTAAEQKIFVRDHLGPEMQKAGCSFKIILFDHNCDSPHYPISILDDPEAKKYADGSGFHLYKGEISALCTVHEAHPDRNIYFTEQSGGGWAPDFGGNLRWFAGNLIIGATRCWSKNVLFWNLALDEHDGPTNNGCKDCWGVVKVSTSGKIKRNAEYYALGHYGKFVKAGAKRVATHQDKVLNSAFINPDGSMVLIAMNTSEDTREITVITGGKNLKYTLLPGMLASFVISF